MDLLLQLAVDLLVLGYLKEDAVYLVVEGLVLGGEHVVVALEGVSLENRAIEVVLDHS